MVDQLITVDSDRGPIEPTPVTIFANGAMVNLGSLSVTRLTMRIPSSAASTNPTLIKSSPGYGYYIHGYNNGAAARYIKFYNVDRAPIVGTDIPILTFYVPASDDFAFDLASVSFTTGIGFGITTGSSDSDTGPVGSNELMGINVVYG